VHAESVAKSEQKLTAAVEESVKAREKVLGELASISKVLEEATKQGTEIQNRKTEVDNVAAAVKIATEETQKSKEVAGKQAAEAEGWATKSKDAYHVVATTGLAGAFNQRAERLTQVSWIWVFVLGAALYLAFTMGGERSKEITALLGAGAVDPVVILIQSVLSVLTVGAPIWMAWLATKQIAHIFRLAEDYGYKASIAKAYEGFRDEAVKLDEQFSARLFATTLQRMDENPLRFVSDTQPGSPMQELFQQPFFQEAINTMPSFKGRFLAFLRRTPYVTPSEAVPKVEPGRTTGLK
jgi:hypothetical protein